MLHAVPRQTHKTMRYPFRTQRINPQRVPSIPAPTGGGGRARPKQVLCASNTHSTYRGIPNHTMGATSVLDHRRGGGGRRGNKPNQYPLESPRLGAPALPSGHIIIRHVAIEDVRLCVRAGRSPDVRGHVEVGWSMAVRQSERGAMVFGRRLCEAKQSVC